MILMIAVALVLGFTLLEVRRASRRQRHLERELARHREAAQSILKELICAAVCLLVIASDARADGPTVITCMPSVNVVVNGKISVAPAREVVQVYWDVSRSMRDFSELKDVVAALDSSVLLLAHANRIEHYGVGATIDPLPSARSALHPSASRTALHLAAEKIGTSLATGTANAALIVSDLELDTPPHSCSGVPLPTNPLAGSLFGRCFEHAVLATKDVSVTRANLLVHLFRKDTHNRQLFILLFATDRAFGTRISDEIARRLPFTRSVIFDSGAVAASNVRGCTLSIPVPDARPRGCGVKCFDSDAVTQSACEIRQPVDAWISPAGTADGNASFDHGMLRFAIPCSAPRGRFDASVSFQWRQQLPPRANQNVRDLFESLADAIVNTTAPRRLHIGIDLQ